MRKKTVEGIRAGWVLLLLLFKSISANKVSVLPVMLLLFKRQVRYFGLAGTIEIEERGMHFLGSDRTVGTYRQLKDSTI